MPPPKKSNPSTKFEAIIQTRDKNKEVHPGLKEKEYTQKRRSCAEMEAFHAQQAQEQKETHEKTTTAISGAARIEDNMRQEDLDRQMKSGLKPVQIPAFLPTVRSTSEVMASFQDGLSIEG